MSYTSRGELVRREQRHTKECDDKYLVCAASSCSASEVLLQSIPSTQALPEKQLWEYNTLIMLTREKQSSAVRRWVQLCVQTLNTASHVFYGGSRRFASSVPVTTDRNLLCALHVLVCSIPFRQRAPWQWENMNTIYRKVLVRPRSSAKQRSRCSWHQWWMHGGRRGEQKCFQALSRSTWLVWGPRKAEPFNRFTSPDRGLAVIPSHKLQSSTSHPLGPVFLVLRRSNKYRCNPLR